MRISSRAGTRTLNAQSGPGHQPEASEANNAQRAEFDEGCLDWLTTLAKTDPLTLILLSVILVLLCVYLGMRIQMVRTQQQGKRQDERAVIEAKRLESEGKNSDAMIALANSVVQRTELERDQAKTYKATIDQLIQENAHHRLLLGQALDTYKDLGDARTKQIDRQFGVSAEQASTIDAIQSAVSDIQQRQGPALDEMRKKVQELQDQVNKLPDDIQAKLQPVFDKIDTELLSLKTDLVKAISEIAIQAAVSPVNITNNVTPPSFLPEITTKLDVTSPSDPPATTLASYLPDSAHGAQNPTPREGSVTL